jgi:hypothetical protein
VSPPPTPAPTTASDARRWLTNALALWPVTLGVFGICLVLTFAWVATRPDVYESKCTLVVRPRPVEGGPDVQALDALVRGVEINATYASIARSALVRDQAEARLGSRDLAAYRVSSEVVTGTNTLALRVRGPDAGVAREFAVAVCDETVSFIDSLDDVYSLHRLDAPRVPAGPESGNQTLTLGLGIVVGALAGVAAATAVTRLREAWQTVRGDDQADAPVPAGAAPAQRAPGGAGAGEAGEPPDGVDRPEEGRPLVDGVDWPGEGRPLVDGVDVSLPDALNRLRAEGTSFCVARLTVAHPGAAEPNGDARLRRGRDRTQLRRVARLLKLWGLGTPNAVATLDGGTLTVLLPRTPAPAAARLLADWAAFAAVDREPAGTGSELQLSIVVHEYPRPAPRAHTEVAPAEKPKTPAKG